jgi:peptidoglycan/xylan/chitin deacetylase (PgdA/CDA1 family)
MIRNTVKNAVWVASRLSGLDAWSRYRMRGRLVSFCYHGVVADRHPERFGYENTVSAAEFTAHMEFLSRNFQPVTAADVARAKNGGTPLPDRAALVTFDDGYRNNLTLAADILRAKGVPALFFVTTGYIGTDRVLWPDEVVGRILTLASPDVPAPEGGTVPLPPGIASRRLLAIQIRNRCKKLPSTQAGAYLNRLRALPSDPAQSDELFGFMSWDEVRSLHRQGFDIGSHTVEHPILTRVGSERLAAELTLSRREIEKELGCSCRFIAYPNGGSDDISPQVFAAARGAGYELGFTVAEQFSEPGEDALQVSRICVQGHLPVSFFRFRASGLDRFVRRRSRGVK